MQLTSFCNSCIPAVRSLMVSWFSTNFPLEKSSTRNSWTLFISSISWTLLIRVSRSARSRSADSSWSGACSRLDCSYPAKVCPISIGWDSICLFNSWILLSSRSALHSCFIIFGFCIWSFFLFVKKCADSVVCCLIPGQIFFSVKRMQRVSPCQLRQTVNLATSFLRGLINLWQVSTSFSLLPVVKPAYWSREVLFSPRSYIDVTLEFSWIEVTPSISSNSLDTWSSYPVRGGLAAIRPQSLNFVWSSQCSRPVVSGLARRKRWSTGKLNGNEGETTNAHTTSRNNHHEIWMTWGWKWRFDANAPVTPWAMRCMCARWKVYEKKSRVRCAVTVSKTAMAFHWISPPLFIQAGLQQVCRSSFLDSASWSVDITIGFGNVMSRCTMIPR